MRRSFFSSSVRTNIHNIIDKNVSCKYTQQLMNFSSKKNDVNEKTEKQEKKEFGDINMPTPLSLGFNIKYQPGEHSSGDVKKKRTIAVVAGWMGAKEKQMKPYLKFYHRCLLRITIYIYIFINIYTHYV